MSVVIKNITITLVLFRLTSITILCQISIIVWIPCPGMVMLPLCNYNLYKIENIYLYHYHMSTTFKCHSNTICWVCKIKRYFYHPATIINNKCVSLVWKYINITEHVILPVQVSSNRSLHMHNSVNLLFLFL